MVRKVKRNKEQLTVKDLKQGQLATIVSPSYKGYVVQRYGVNIVIIGNSSINTFGKNSDLEIEIIPNGSLLEVLDNE